LVPQQSRFVIQIEDSSVVGKSSADAEGLLRSAVRAAGAGEARIGRRVGRHGEIEVSIASSTRRTARQTAELIGLQANVRFVAPIIHFGRDTFDVIPVNRFVVSYRSDLGRPQIAAIERRYGLEIEALPAPDSGRFEYWYRYPRGAKQAPFDLVAELTKSPNVKWAAPDWINTAYQLSQASNDPYYSFQYYLKNTSQYNGVPVDINAENAWRVNKGGGLPSAGGMIVAVIDEGVQASHPDFGGRVSFGFDAFGNNSYCCVSCAANPSLERSHGTNAAGIIAASRDNLIGIAGVAPEANILPIRIFDDNSVSGTPAQIAQAINYAWSTGGAHVISNSWGVPPSPFGPVPEDPGINNAINNAVTLGRGGKGTIVVFSAGNNSNRAGNFFGAVSWPASRPNVISVGAITSSGTPANYTPRGSRIDVVAPSSFNTSLSCPEAGDLATTLNIGSSCSANRLNGDPAYTNTFGGTSAAAPQVAAIAALLLTDQPNLTFTQVRDRIKLRAVGWGNSQDFGTGKVDAYRTLRDELKATINGKTVAKVGNNTFTANVGGGLGPYTYRWYIAYGQGSTTFYDTGNTSLSITQNFVQGDYITFRFVVTDQIGSVTTERIAYTL
jgi:subtilisin family serine protease